MSQQQHGAASGSPTEPTAASSSRAGLSTLPGPHTLAAGGTESTSNDRDPRRELPVPPIRRDVAVSPGGSERPPTKLLGVHAILNHPTTEHTYPSTKRQSLAPLESPRPVETSESYFPRHVSAQHHVAEDLSPTTIGPAREAGSRRILSPRSPLRKTASLTNLNPPSASAAAANASTEAFRSPFVAGASTGRKYSAEPGVSGVPPLPSPSAAQSHSYQPGFPPVAHTTPLNPARRTSLNPAVQSAGASPTMAYSPYPSQTSPATPSGTFLQGGEYHSQFNPRSAPQSRRASVINTPTSAQFPSPLAQAIHQAHPSQPPITLSTPNPSVSSSATAQSTYQMMTVETNRGPVQLPVDIQAASRHADEKRRRNAGASARFRQRRKQKEVLASSTISELQTQIRDLEEDVEFYRGERDALRDIVWKFSASERDRHFPRPTSPQHSRKPISSRLLNPDQEDMDDRAHGGADAGPRSSSSSGVGSGSGLPGHAPPAPPLSSSSTTIVPPGYVTAEGNSRRRTSAHGMGPRPGESPVAGFAPGVSSAAAAAAAAASSPTTHSPLGRTPSYSHGPPPPPPHSHPDSQQRIPSLHQLGQQQQPQPPPPPSPLHHQHYVDQKPVVTSSPHATMHHPAPTHQQHPQPPYR